MVKKRRKKTLEKPEPQSDFFDALTGVAVAQICQSAGFASAKPSAFRALTSVADLYLQTLAAQAASRSNGSNRTQSNLFDFAAALEDLHSGKGFVGASDVSRPLLRSSLLVEIMDFVDRVDEVPFAQPIRRSLPVANPRIGSEADVSRAQHIPLWLPPFPDPSTYQEADGGEKLRLGGNGEVLLPYGSAVEVSVSGGDQQEEGYERRKLQAERSRVKFKFDVKRKKEIGIKAHLRDNVFCVDGELRGKMDEKYTTLEEKVEGKADGEVRGKMDEKYPTLEEDERTVCYPSGLVLKDSERTMDEKDEIQKEKLEIKVYVRKRLLLKDPEKRIVRRRKCSSLSG